jgi:RNA polymerase sigma factor (sigma-70 family)
MMIEMEAKVRQPKAEQSFDEFFASVFPRAQAVARRIVGPSLAEDMAIEGVARAYARWNTLTKMEYPEAWVLRVVTNLALDEVRRKRVPLSEITVRDASSDFVIHDSVVKAIRSLTKRQQEVVVLRYIADLPEVEVARILGMSTGTVGTHLHRAIARLRTYMTEEESP